MASRRANAILDVEPRGDARPLEAGPSIATSPSSPPPRRRRSSAPDPSWTADRKYALLVDAGSSGSRLQIYSWKDPLATKKDRIKHGKHLKVLPKVEKGTQEGTGQEWQWKVEPGISSFATHSHDLPAYLDPLFAHALDVIPPHLVASTPVYIMATAGMRLLPLEQQQDIIDTTCSFIRSHTPFHLPGTCQDHVQVITGEEEGLLGWIAINYLMDGFHFKEKEQHGDQDAQSKDAAAAIPASKGKSTYGFLDMGGASTQIAFEPSKKALAKVDKQDQHEDLSRVTLKLLDGSQVNHDVFVTTFLGFGTNKARDRYEQQLLLESSPTRVPTAIQDPCLPVGALRSATASADATNSTSTFSGNGSFTNCLTSLAPLLDKSAPCSHPPCLFHGVHVPPIDFSVNHFIGVSEYWFSSHDVFNLGGVYDFVQFQQAAQKFCKRPWKDLETSLGQKQEFPPQVDESRLKMQCFKAAWMVTVLHDGIGLPRVIDHKGKGDGKPHVDEVGLKAGQKNLGEVGGGGGGASGDWFQSVNEVEGTAVSWTLGKAVLEATKDIQSVPSVDGTHLPTPTPLSSDSWELPATGAAAAKHAASSPFAVAFLALAVFCIGAFIFTRGRSPSAQRRRNALRFLLPPPLGSCFGVFSGGAGGGGGSKGPITRGDYTLASMEEGFDDMDANANANLSDSSSSEDLRSEPLVGRRGKRTGGGSHHRRKISGGLLSFLPLIARRWVLQGASYLPGTQASKRARRRHQRNRSEHESVHWSSSGRGGGSGAGGEGVGAMSGSTVPMDEVHMHSMYPSLSTSSSSLSRAYSPNPHAAHAAAAAASVAVGSSSLPMMRASRPGSPALASLSGAISRPASRNTVHSASASGRNSPRPRNVAGAGGTGNGHGHGHGLGIGGYAHGHGHGHGTLTSHGGSSALLQALTPLGGAGAGAGAGAGTPSIIDEDAGVVLPGGLLRAASTSSLSSLRTSPLASPAVGPGSGSGNATTTTTTTSRVAGAFDADAGVGVGVGAARQQQPLPSINVTDEEP